MPAPPRRKDLSLCQQLLLLRTSPNCPGRGGISGGRLIWRFDARPTPLSRTSSIRIEYRSGAAPDVFVEKPNLVQLAAGRELPHIYRNPLRLCLYMPQTGQWSATKRIDMTIVPWTHLWLFYFEDWLAFGEWKGGGKHPGDDDEPPRNRQTRRAMRQRRHASAVAEATIDAGPL